MLFLPPRQALYKFLSDSFNDIFAFFKSKVIQWTWTSFGIRLLMVGWFELLAASVSCTRSSKIHQPSGTNLAMTVRLSMKALIRACWVQMPVQLSVKVYLQTWQGGSLLLDMLDICQMSYISAKPPEHWMQHRQLTHIKMSIQDFAHMIKSARHNNEKWLHTCLQLFFSELLQRQQFDAFYT